MNRLSVRSTLLDRAIGYVSPARALRRMHARARLAVAERFFASGYIGGTSDRKSLQDYHPAAGSADTDFLPQAYTLRARSRDQVRNSPVAAAAIDTQVISAIGTGLRVQSQIDRDLLGLSEAEADAWQQRAETIWAIASDSIDLESELSFPALTRLAFRSVLESGDVLVIRRFKPRPGDLLGVKLQLIEADRISNPNWTHDTERIAGGVEVDEDGRPVAYYVASSHPGDFFRIGPTTWSRIPVRGRSGERIAKLLFDKRRPGQRRGVPYLAPVIEQLKQLSRLTEAELQAAVVASLFTVFIRTESGDELLTAAPPGEPSSTEVAPSDPGRQGDIYLRPGAVIGLAEGEDVVTAAPNRPNDLFEPFFRAIVQQIGMALGIPFEVLTKHFQASYSAARAALLEAWRFIRVWREWMAAEFCQFAYEAVITEAVARGLIEAPGFLDSPFLRHAWLGTTWTGDSPGQVDPLKEVQAASLSVREGFSTIAQETVRLNGGDWERNHRQRVREARMRREAGLDREPVAERVISEKPEEDTEEAA